jgi:preprotein translocase subunit SecE
VSEDREQDRAEERDSASRPVTAAARRERRATARDTSAKARNARVEDRVPTTKASAPVRRVRDRAEDSDTLTESRSGGDTAKKGRATAVRDRKDKRPSIFARLVRFTREVIAELRKVIWPTRRQQITYTIVVLVFVAIIVAVVSGLDLLFAKGVFWVFA